jgi:hypothetical protein
MQPRRPQIQSPPPSRQERQHPPSPQRRPPKGNDEDFDEDDEDNEGGGGGGVGVDDLDLIGGDDPIDTFGSDPNYNQAVAKGQYIRVHFVKPLLLHIDMSDLFPDTKETLKIMVQGLFDKTQVLAKRTNLKLAEIEVEIILTQARMGFHPSDVNNPALGNIYNLIRSQYTAFISRSEKGWERELDNRMETSHTQRIVDDRFQQQQGQQRQQYPFYHPKRWF